MTQILSVFEKVRQLRQVVPGAPLAATLKIKQDPRDFIRELSQVSAGHGSYWNLQKFKYIREHLNSWSIRDMNQILEAKWRLGLHKKMGTHCELCVYALLKTSTTLLSHPKLQVFAHSDYARFLFLMGRLIFRGAPLVYVGGKSQKLLPARIQAQEWLIRLLSQVDLLKTSKSCVWTLQFLNFLRRKVHPQYLPVIHKLRAKGEAKLGLNLGQLPAHDLAALAGLNLINLNLAAHFANQANAGDSQTLKFLAHPSKLRGDCLEHYLAKLSGETSKYSVPQLFALLRSAVQLKIQKTATLTQLAYGIRGRLDFGSTQLFDLIGLLNGVPLVDRHLLRDLGTKTQWHQVSPSPLQLVEALFALLALPSSERHLPQSLSRMCGFLGEAPIDNPKRHSRGNPRLNGLPSVHVYLDSLPYEKPDGERRQTAGSSRVQPPMAETSGSPDHRFRETPAMASGPLPDRVKHATWARPTYVWRRRQRHRLQFFQAGDFGIEDEQPRSPQPKGVPESPRFPSHSRVRQVMVALDASTLKFEGRPGALAKLAEILEVTT